MNVFVFDIETVPDVAAGRRIYALDQLSDDDVAQVMFHKRREKTGGSDFLPLHLHRVVAISAVFYAHDQIKVWSLGQPESSERELVQRFFDGLEKFVPTLVSWNGGGFDLPVLHYRCLLHGIQASRYWDSGEDDRDFRWNNYLSRYHWRHIDLMDVLAGFQPRANAPLDQVATMLGFPGKMGMSGAKVWDQFQAGEIHAIRNYCETDVLNTFLVYLRFELMRGKIDEEQFQQTSEQLRDYLQQQNKPHFNEFLTHWRSDPAP